MSIRKSDSSPIPSAANGGEHSDAWLAELLSQPGPPDPSRFSELQAELSRPEPKKRRRWPVLLLLPISALAVVASRAWLGDRSLWRLDLGNLGERLSLGIAALLLCAAAAIAVAMHRGRSGFGLPSGPVRWLSIGLTALVGLTPLLLRGTTPQPALNALGAPCAAVVIIAGALALGVAGVLFRRTQPVGASARALGLGAAAAAWTGIVISLHCPGESLTHLLWGHSLPLLALVGLAAWLLPRQLQP
jgi:hypothetical protein